ncbi:MULTISPECIES: iron-containing redox enzyme family protein [unclassified Streptomyces]|uniref:iron-containing redox enzyme family protein n=1 Tax=unclassified Streptomyces TaxID=2593676 RepID=UPI00081E116D|nr:MULTISPECIES: iron-containing redox enzyme family protein [unclassified Streptomyces]MYR96705.1 iron-containing redox enzyme family protein [Streptomyces sp. SID4937]SCE14850.1 Iron-containing redox enzyme [Streptomyces sp. ScaeMP-e83]
MHSQQAAATATLSAEHQAGRPHGLPGDGGSARTVYAYATDPEASLPEGRFVEEVRTVLHRHATATDDGSLDALVRQAADWGAAERERYRTLAGDEEGPEGHHQVLVRRAVLGCAPLALLSGAWLQWLSAPGNADDPLVLRILALYASDVGAGHPAASRGSAYLELLRWLRLAENAAPAARLTGDQRIPDGAFRLPALLLAMSRRPDDFRGGILGADLCLRAVGLLPALELVREVLPTGADWPALDPGELRGTEGPLPVEQCRAAVDALVAVEGERGAAAARSGFRWMLAGLRDWSEALHAELVAAGDPAFDMAELMRLRSREGAVYHHQFLLEGKPLARWLAECRTDPGPLLDVLARSKLVKPGRSGASSLVRGLVGERGPMFRVFSPEDLTVIRRWIDSLPVRPADTHGAGAETARDARPPRTPSPAAGPQDPLAAVAGALRAGARSPGRTPSGLREAYHLLMTRTDTPALRSWAMEYVAGWLARSGHGMDRTAMPLPERWGHEGLRPWLQAQHDRHGAEFEENAAIPLPSKEAVVDDTVQTAPLTLIDGSWLQGFTDYEQASSAIGHSLFETYWDELGNGEPHLNHPLIYRDVLKEMGVELPPTASAAFAQWPGFREESLELPVYWLCVGRFPQTFLPEVLGLNLAMELSGVGGTYRRARLALKAYGFSTRFVDIHNTIDNVATGHSAWAADAVDTLLASLPDAPGPGARADVWSRVRVGYRSLNPPRSVGARLAARRTRFTGRRR